MRFGNDAAAHMTIVAKVLVVLALANWPASAIAQQKGQQDPMVAIRAMLERTKLMPQINNLTFEGRYAEALPLAEKLLALTTVENGLSPSDIAWSNEQLARVYEGLGRWAEAEAATRKALAINESLGASGANNAVTNRTRLAIFFEAQGRLADAEKLYAAAGPRASTMQAEVAHRLNYLSVIRDAQGRHDDAELIAKRALVLRQQTIGPEHADTGLTMNNLAMTYWALGRKAEAAPLLRRAIGIIEKTKGAGHPDLAKLVGNLASVLAPATEAAEIEGLQKRALQINQAAYGPEHREVISDLNNLAVHYRDVGRLDEADATQARAVQLSEASLARYQSNDLARAFLDLPARHARLLTSHAGIRIAQGRHDDALRMLARALETEQGIRGKEHPAVAHVLTRMGDAHAAAGKALEAHKAYAQGAAIHVARYRAARQAAREAGAGRGGNDTSRDTFLGLAAASTTLAGGDREKSPGLIDEGFQAVQWAERSSAAAALARMSARFASGTDVLAALARQRQDLDEERNFTDRELSGALSAQPSASAMKTADTLRQRVAGLEARIGEIDGRLKREFPDYFALVNPEPLSIGDTQALLRPSEALVQFAVGPKGTLAWLVGKSEARAIAIPLGAIALAEKIEALRCGLDRAAWNGAGEKRCSALLGRAKPKDDAPLPFPMQPAHELYRALLQPFEASFRGKELMIVPSGPLISIPFGVLQTAAPEKPFAVDAAAFRSAEWLGTRQAMTVLPSIGSVAALRKGAARAPAPKTFIGFANPLLDGNPNDAEQRDLARLARERQQCGQKPAQVATAAQRGTRSTGPAAVSGRPDIAHIRRQVALPETADEVCAVAASVRATADDLRLGARATEREVKTLSASGALAQFRVVHFATHAALAGEIGGAAEPGLILTPPDAPSEADDGYLAASEVAQLKLNADWVVLSACNTAAGGGATAEPLSGLTRAFFYAGARTLLVSHWAVDSEATVRLITRMFRELEAPPAGATAGPSRAEAMRRALAAMVTAGNAGDAHPEYWAPFVVVGEPSGVR